MPSCFRNSRVVRRRNPVRLWSCALESRIAPATFIVDDLSDDFALLNNPAPGTLRYAVNQTNRNDGADQIIIIRMGMITLSAPRDVSEGVFIDPFGATDLSIDFSKMTTPGPGFFNQKSTRRTSCNVS